LFAEFFIYSKHKPDSAPRLPLLMRSIVLGLRLSQLPKPSASDVARAEFGHCRAMGFGQ
jgi:hypothetical protein